MMRTHSVMVGGWLAGLVLVGGPAHAAAPAAAAEIDPPRLAAFKALPAVMEDAANPVTDAKVKLGKVLYFENRLSKNQKLSCNSCHGLTTYGVDGEPTSLGHKDQRGGRNSPSVYNAAGHLAQFWDGRAASVEEQAKGPVLNPVEMALPDAAAAEAVLRSMPEYQAMFKAAFPADKEPVTFDNMARAIGAFERKLVTPSRWDKYLAGDKKALTAEEKAGFNTFVDTGCTACHNGAFVGGSTYMKLGMVKPWPDVSDLGRFAVTKAEADKFMFKVPSLRNVEKTGPYFHTGKVSTMEEAVKLMADHQLGKQLTDVQVKSIVTWLKTLTGTLPADVGKPPVLPKSSKTTPPPAE